MGKVKSLQGDADAVPASAKWPWRYPPTAAGIQVNHCKNPRCPNFGVPPDLIQVERRGRKGYKLKAGDYIFGQSSGTRDIPSLLCPLCREKIPMQSNLAIAEELLRISQYLESPAVRCPAPSCGASDRHARYGVNAHGTPRYRCWACKKVFAFGGKSTKRQRRTHVNRDIFEHLVNAMPLRRIIKVLKISPATLYDKLDFIHRQCLLFAGERERTLVDRVDLGKRYVTTDRQQFMVNWSTRADRRNTLMKSLASADLTTGYVFAVNLNYDPDLVDREVESDAIKYGDYRLAHPFRRYARVWLSGDYDEAAKTADASRSEKAKERAAEALAAPSLSDISAAIEATYADAADRDDVEAGESPILEARTSERGMSLHEQIVMNAHIQLVARLLQSAQKIRFFMDQESGLRAAFMAALAPRILNRTADGFFVKVIKNRTIDQKRKTILESVRRFNDAQKANPTLSNADIEVLLARIELDRAVVHGQWGDRWFAHPRPDMREPEKMVCWLTDIDAPEEGEAREDQLNHFARLHLKASLNAVDRFFMQVRRGLTLAERGVISASAARRVWYGKNAYHPNNLAKLLEIFRTYFNYCEVGKDKKTPAMRLGLAKGPVASEDILYYVPKEPARLRGPSERPDGTPVKKLPVSETLGASESRPTEPTPYANG